MSAIKLSCADVDEIKRSFPARSAKDIATSFHISVPHVHKLIAGTRTRKPTISILDIIESKIERIPECGCWIWMGKALGWGGYPQIRYARRTHPVHRLMWELKNGPMQKSNHACHSCDLPLCVNPDHIWPGTRSDNISDAIRKGRMRFVRNELCRKGHPLKGNGRNRFCQTCRNIRQRESRVKKYRK